MRLQGGKCFTFLPGKTYGYQDAPGQVRKFFGRAFWKGCCQTALQIMVLINERQTDYRIGLL
jgi:hypothetical protein